MVCGAEIAGWAKVSSLIARNAATPTDNVFLFFSAAVWSVEGGCDINGIQSGLFICVVS